MWALFPYALLPIMMYGPSFGVTSMSFAMKVLMKWMVQNGYMEMFMGGEDSL